MTMLNSINFKVRLTKKGITILLFIKFPHYLFFNWEFILLLEIDKSIGDKSITAVLWQWLEFDDRMKIVLYRWWMIVFTIHIHHMLSIDLSWSGLAFATVTSLMNTLPHRWQWVCIFLNILESVMYQFTPIVSRHWK